MIKIYTCLEIYDKLLTNSDNVAIFLLLTKGKNGTT